MHKKKFINRSLYAVLTVGVSSALFSCQNDMHEDIAGNESDIVSFCIDKSSWGDASDTRSGSGKGMREIDRAVLRTSESNDTLCLRAIESDGIDLGPSVSTRGSSIGDVSALSSFGCFAYTEQNGYKFYINNEEYSKGSDGKFTSENIYYWPGVQQNLSLDFYCYAPYNCNGLTVPSVASESGTRFLEYAVPTDVSKQQDLMLAEGAPGTELKALPGNCNKVLALSFKHLLSAVRIVTGSNMQSGTVKSVSFKNLYGSANIDMDNPTAWQDYSLYESSYTVSPNVTVTSGQADQVIVGGDNTLLMLPQAMKPVDGLEPTILTIVFNDGTKDRTLETELTGEWLMGKTYTYHLSITPEYTLEFNETEPIADAHYVIKPIHIKAGDLNGSSYTVVSSNPDICKLRANLVGPEEQGYWPKESTGGGDFIRSNSLSLNAEGDVLVYAFLTENTTEADRTVDLQLQYNGSTVNTLTLTQKCPVWTSDGTMGWENTEEDPEKPFGFAWTRKITYNSNTDWPSRFIMALAHIFYSDIQGTTWTGLALAGNLKITVDYSRVQNLSNVYSEVDGLTNTKGFSYNSASQLAQMEDLLSRYCSISSQTGENIESTDFAALVCLKKNACNVEKQTQGGQIAYNSSFADDDIKWYLPASGQFTGMPADMNGKVYWSSTAINDNANAYSWNGAAAPTPRMENLNVRAVRVKD